MPRRHNRDMAGASITVMHLDDELQRMIDHS
ncbi:MAG: dihydroxyacetone kinase subunit DhaK, partial [Mesorhizobium sp.]